jgi:carboxymethylenebutenolidase
MPPARIPRTHADTDLPAHVAFPPVGPGPWPGVVVVHEVLGLTDDIREITARFAAAGFVAVAPDLYADGGARHCLVATFKALSSGRGKAFDDLDATRRWVAARADCTGRVGIAGFCMGGAFALLSAARGFGAASSNYGVLPDDLDGVLRGACPVVGSYGARDRGLKGAAAKLEAALERAGVEHDVKEYPDAGHSFMNRHGAGPLGPVLRVAGIAFHQPSSEDAWRRILRFFDQHLADPAIAQA